MTDLPFTMICIGCDARTEVRDHGDAVRLGWRRIVMHSASRRLRRAVKQRTGLTPDYIGECPDCAEVPS